MLSTVSPPDDWATRFDPWFGLNSSLPLQIRMRICSSAFERHDVIDDITWARSRCATGRRARVLALESAWPSRCVRSGRYARTKGTRTCAAMQRCRAVLSVARIVDLVPLPLCLGKRDHQGGHKLHVLYIGRTADELPKRRISCLGCKRSRVQIPAARPAFSITCRSRPFPQSADRPQFSLRGN